MPHTKITQAYVDGLPFQDSGTLWVHDTELAGFNLSIGQRTKTYCAAGEHGKGPPPVPLQGWHSSGVSRISQCLNAGLSS